MKNLKKKLRPIIGNWVDVGLHEEFRKDYMKKIQQKVKSDRTITTVYPPSDQVFRALKLCGPKETKVVIVGQDPYHDGSANGLAFSNDGDYQNISPSLRNIFKEIERDLGFKDIVPNPDLTRWAEQGVLLLNTSLTVREGSPGSHSNIGWQKFTGKIIKYCDLKEDPVVFLLWGNHAKDLVGDYINALRGIAEKDEEVMNEILYASHPSNFSAHLSFDGCGHFSKTNEFLKKHELEPIDWV